MKYAQTAGNREFWTVRNRLVFGYAIEILITLLLGVYALTRLSAIKADSMRLSQDSLPALGRIYDIDSRVGRLYGLSIKTLASTNAQHSIVLGKEVRADLEALNHGFAELERSVPAESHDKSGFEPTRAALAAFSNAVVALANLEFERSAERASVLADQLDPTYRRLQEAIKLAMEQKRSLGAAASEEIQTAVNRAEAGIVAGIMASIFIVVFSGYYIVRAINQPLVKLTEAMENMREGDFASRLEVNRHDEFGELAAGFNHMADSLSALVSQVQESGIVLNSSATHLAGTSRQHESGAQETAATTVEIGATAKEISATSQELVKTVKEVAQVAEQTTTMAGNGQSGLLRMQETMVQVMSAASGISGKLTVLNDKAGSISQVVTTIAKVADQTNLLSLNAAIEAEKAGEYGRGFSVVATEIRRLADQTAVASHDIEQTVKEMQAAVSSGVMSVDKFSEEVRRGVQEVNQVSAQLNEIIQHVQALTPRFESVNEGMQMHAIGAQQISSALSQLGESTQQTVQSLRQSNVTIERLNEASSLLRSAVSQFKLNTSVPLIRDSPAKFADLSVKRTSDQPKASTPNLDM